MQLIKKNRFVLLLLIQLAFSAAFLSCSKKTEDIIVFNNSYPLALAPDVTWAVITNPYAAYRADKSWGAESRGYCRKGEILQDLGKSVDENNVLWYKFEQGWLPSDCLAEYSNRYKALSVSKSFGESE